MKAFLIKSDWLLESDRRLDASTYFQGGLRAREKILAGPHPIDKLGNVADCYLPPRFARRYVQRAEFGVPFISSSDMLLVELSDVSLLSREATSNLQGLTVPVSATLVSRSGTVGRTAYVRRDMASSAFSEHAIRVVGKDDTLLPGFLFSFLSTEAAQAMIRQQIYGSVVQHIEPSHLQGLPVPVGPPDLQAEVNALVERASEQRSQAAALLDRASGDFDAKAGDMRLTHEHAFAVEVVQRSDLQGRLDAFSLVGWAAEGSSMDGDQIGDLGTVTRPGIFRRIFPTYGVPFVSGIDAYQLGPQPRHRLMQIEAERAGALIQEGQILVQRSGQRYGLLGRPAYVTHRMHGWAASEDLMRITLHDVSDRGRVFAFLRSDIGRRRLVGRSYGTSIPHFNVQILSSIKVPSLSDELVDASNQGLELREQADLMEIEAIQKVEAWLA